MNFPFSLILTLTLLAVGAYAGWRYWRMREITIGWRALKRTTLHVIVPKDVIAKENEAPTTFRDHVAKIEPFFSALTSVVEKDWKRQIFGQDHFVFDIVADKGEITFYISGPRHLQTLLEKQIHAHFPDAHIEAAWPNIFAKDEGAFASTTLQLGGNPLFPIKTYKNMEDDPLNGLANTLSKLGEDSAAVVSVLLRPTLRNFQKRIQTASAQLQQGKSAGLPGTDKVVSSLISETAQIALMGGNVKAEDKRPEKPATLTPLQEEQLRQLAEKGSKPVFETMIRIITVATDRPTAKSNLENLVTSFGQYTTPNVFFKSTKHVGAEGKVVTDYILQAFRGGKKMFLNIEELSSIFHLPNQHTTAPNIRWLVARRLPPAVNLPKEGIVIGEAVYRGERKLVRLKEDDRRRHLFMIGKTGVGKTTLFTNMAMQDIVAGKGVCFIDPLGDAIEGILARIPRERSEDVILFDPSDTDRPMGLNLLDWKRAEEKDFLVSEWIEIFYKLYDPGRTGIIGPQWEHWGRNAALTVMSLPGGGSLIDIPRLFTDDEFRTYAIAQVTDPVVKSFWVQQLAKTADFHKSEMYNYFISKFGRFMTNDLMRNIIGQTQSGFDLREVMDSGKILLVNLSKGKIGETNAQLLGLILVSKLQAAAFSRAELAEEQRRDFYLYVDEFHNFTTDTFATILSEARKYRLSLAITNQYIAQLTEKVRDAVIGNVGTMVVYRIGASDADFLLKEFSGLTASDFMNLDRFSTYTKLLIDGSPTVPFSMSGKKTDILADSAVALGLKQLSRLKFATDRKVVEQAFNARLEQGKDKPESSAVFAAIRREAGV